MDGGVKRRDGVAEMKEEFANAFMAPAQLVWESQLSQPLKLLEAKVISEYEAPENVTAVIGVTGQLQGNVLYEFENTTGLAVASTMMGEELDEHDEISMSALGELANMISGNAATKLSEQGILCDITPPEVSSDTERNSVHLPGAQFIAAFTSGLGLFNIRIGLAESA